MKGEHFGLVTRLREGRTNGTSLRWSVTDIHREAADRIEALEAWKAEARDLLESSLCEFAPISAENHRRDVIDFLAALQKEPRP